MPSAGGLDRNPSSPEFSRSSSRKQATPAAQRSSPDMRVRKKAGSSPRSRKPVSSLRGTGSGTSSTPSRQRALRVYLSGPISHKPDAQLAFDRAVMQLHTEGLSPVLPPGIANPVTPDSAAYDEVIREDLRILLACDEVRVLPGWEQSPGASLEVAVAKLAKIPVKTLDGRLLQHASKVAGRPQLAYLGPAALLELARVASYGAVKYGAHDFRQGGSFAQALSAAYRHLLAFQAGEDLDSESGLPHLAHAAWHCLAIIQWQKDDVGSDDRWKGG